MQRLISLLLLVWTSTGSFAQDAITIDLGPTEEVKALYSYPNNCAEVCYLSQTLSQTIERYLHNSLNRDGYGANTNVVVFEASGRVNVRLDGAGANDYAKILPKYLAAGSIGLQIARDLAIPAPDGHRLWRYNWRFFLPHGVAMAQHHAVQLLHFPPDNVLMDAQDYLAAATTRRWAKLLVLELERDGAAPPPNEVARYQNIIDIDPISAPDKDGDQLQGVDSYFNSYINALLNLFLPLPMQGGSRPLIAFGEEARSWLRASYDDSIHPERVLELVAVTLASGLKVPALTANHPSYIWNQVRAERDDPNTPQNEQLALAMKIMREDVIAACWEVRMGTTPTGSPQDTLSACTNEWSERDRELCELSYAQIFHRPSDCAKVGPELILSVSDEKLNALRKALGSLESAEPGEEE
jgi:hypothetical protein